MQSLSEQPARHKYPFDSGFWTARTNVRFKRGDRVKWYTGNDYEPYGGPAWLFGIVTDEEAFDRLRVHADGSPYSQDVHPDDVVFMSERRVH